MLTLFHDYTSPASAIAALRMARLADDGLPIAFEGFEAVGIDIAMPVDLETIARLQRLAADAEALDLAWRRPPSLPPTGLAHVLVHHVQERAETGSEAAPDPAAALREADPSATLREAIYRALWEQGADIGDPAVLGDIAGDCGLASAVHVLADRVALADRRRRMATHRRAGVGGVPVVLASRTLVPGLLSEGQLRALAQQV